MGSKIIKQLMNFVKVLLPHQKTNVSNCREAIFQALSTCNAIRIYLVYPNGVGTDSGMQNLDKRRGKKVMPEKHSNSKKKNQEPHWNLCFLIYSNGLEIKQWISAA